jgi:phosphoribosylamine--glycine ligase
MRVLVVGSGGREHALVWKLLRSPSVKKVYCAPGNGGIEQHAELVPIQQTDIESLAQFARQEQIDLTVVGPEQPLTMGIVDLFESAGMRIFGPSKNAAMLEGSKSFSKDFMRRNGIPTARYKKFSISELHEAEKFIGELEPPVVVKADGLAGGKGVVICESKQEATRAMQSMILDKTFGDAGERVVIEEFLKGEEASVFALTDGRDFAILSPAQDHKRILDGDQGKNTGGMGAYAPAPVVTAQLTEEVVKEVVIPTLDGMRKIGSPYRGCLYCGLMITSEGVKVLEYNCRFGDPEAQVVVPLVEGDFGEILLGAASGRLQDIPVKSSSAAAVCVVMASAGYPEHYEVGKEIKGLDALNSDDIIAFHAGTKREADRIVSSGGRVLGVTAIEQSGNLEKAIEEVYKSVDKVKFDGAYFRRDIGQKALKKVKTLG